VAGCCSYHLGVGNDPFRCGRCHQGLELRELSAEIVRQAGVCDSLRRELGEAKVIMESAAIARRDLEVLCQDFRRRVETAAHER